MLLADQNRLTRIEAPYVTIALVIGCTGLFLLELLGAEPPLALVFFPDILAQYPGDPLAWLGLVGHVLLHGGFLHLLGNMIALAAFGDNVEDAFGHLRYLLFLAVCAAAGATAWALTVPPGHALIGASGAISGIMAAYLLLYPRARIVMLVVKYVPVAAPASWFVGLWLLANLVHAAGLLGPEEDEMPTAWFAHLGGFAAGLLLTLFARPAGVKLFCPGPAGDEQPGWLMRRAIYLGPRGGSGDPWTFACVVKALLFLVAAGAGMLFAI